MAEPEKNSCTRASSPHRGRTTSAKFHDYLVCYDIKHARNLRAVNRYMRGTGIPIQRSVFICRLAGRQHAEMIEKLESLVDDGTDDVRIYRMRATSEITFQGCRPLPEGLHLDAWNFVSVGDRSSSSIGDAE